MAKMIYSNLGPSPSGELKQQVAQEVAAVEQQRPNTAKGIVIKESRIKSSTRLDPKFEIEITTPVGVHLTRRALTTQDLHLLAGLSQLPSKVLANPKMMRRAREIRQNVLQQLVSAFKQGHYKQGVSMPQLDKLLKH
jgi:hypothetical protein